MNARKKPSPKRRPPRLAGLVTALAKFHGSVAIPPVRDPYRLLLWEQVAYLADDATRLTAFRLLEQLVGTEPDAILAAPIATLKRVTRAGGSIGVDVRAHRLQTVAGRVADHWDGDLGRILALPFADARRELTKYPSIGKPGAERILLLCGAATTLGLDSNALRVLLRLGYGRDADRYESSYSSAQSEAEKELPSTVVARRRAYLTLRAHGLSVCRRSRPECTRCPIRAQCPTGRAVTKA